MGFIKLLETTYEVYVDQVHVTGVATKAGYKLGWHLFDTAASICGDAGDKQVRLQVHKKNSARMFYSKASFNAWGSYYGKQWLPPAGDQWTSADAPSSGYEVSCPRVCI